MRTITEKFARRLEAQAKEAKLQGLTKVADHVSKMVDKHKTRDTDSSYTYAKDDLESDVERKVWEGVVRAADFFDCDVDAAEMQKIVTKLAHILVEEVRIKGGVRHGVGAYEPSVPGEARESVMIEITDQE